MRGWAIFFLAAGLVVAAAQAGWAEGVAAAGQGQTGKNVTATGGGGDHAVVALAKGVNSPTGGGVATGMAGRAAGVPQAPAAKRPAGADKGQAKPVAVDVSAVKGLTPDPVSTLPPMTYAPVADGGGVALYLANLARPGAEATGGPDERVAEFNASKNRYSIEVRLSQRRLYLYENLPDGSRHLARTYTVAVPGREMEAPQGWGVVTGISFEPWWRPTPAMKERARKKGKELPEVVKPGVKENPMGPFKIILSHGYGFRIHGNNNPGSIGRPVTSGCIRMRNDEGKDMAKMIDVGTEVVFLQ
jgi:lipoprotein-anchoring transpeptidase ErfK/SrfK